jgi:predicted DNA-binding protein YlxM (UPF0122 family)
MWVAVETSDLVASTHLSKLQNNEVLQGLKALFSEFEANDIALTEFYRGDGFQILYKKPHYAARYTLVTKLFLLSQFSYSVAVTQSLCIGKVDTYAKPLSEKMDKVFIHSGRQLDAQEKGEIAFAKHYVNQDFVLASKFLNRMLSQLTTKQAEVLYWYIKLDFPDQQSIANKLNMTRQNVNTHLLRANTDLIRIYINHFTDLCEKLDSDKEISE